MLSEICARRAIFISVIIHIYGKLVSVKTTVEIPDRLFREAKKLAAERGLPMRELIEEGLRRVVETSAPGSRRKFHLRDGSFGEGGPLIDLNWETLRGVVYEERGS
jgi:hypothetical protein